MKPRITKLSCFWVVILFLNQVGRVSAGPLIDEDPAAELRLRLEDRRQEVSTTAINWIDLVPEKKVKSGEAASLSRRFKILIDIGHGGRDLGAQGLCGISEKDLCLHIGRLVKQELENAVRQRHLPLEVKLSRDADEYLPLSKRAQMANNWGADLFLSIHVNSSPATYVRGFEVYFLSQRPSDSKARTLALLENEGEESGPIKSEVLSMISDAQTTFHLEESSKFAESVFAGMSERLHANGRGIRQGPFAVLGGTFMPAVLVEIGYLTNPQEAQLLKRGVYLKRLANAISTGIIQFATTYRKLI